MKALGFGFSISTGGFVLFLYFSRGSWKPLGFDLYELVFIAARNQLLLENKCKKTVQSP